MCDVSVITQCTSRSDRAACPCVINKYDSRCKAFSTCLDMYTCTHVHVCVCVGGGRGGGGMWVYGYGYGYVWVCVWVCVRARVGEVRMMRDLVRVCDSDPYTCGGCIDECEF